MMTIVIEKLGEVIASQPDAVLALERVGARRPSTSAELPTIAVSLAMLDSRGRGLGGYIRSGDVLTQSRAIVDVRAGEGTFSDDLRRLRLAPLPLKQSPASTGRGFTEQDVRVANVTDPARPLAYQFVERPTQRDHYRVRAEAGTVHFGAPQTAGERLEVTHWTMTWHEDVQGYRYAGSATLELWASGASQAADLSRRLQARLQASREELRRQGFLKLQPAGLTPVEHVLHQAPAGSPFPVWRQQLLYTFAFEAELGGELSAGDPIRRIDVDLTGASPEAFAVPAVPPGP